MPTDPCPMCGQHHDAGTCPDVFACAYCGDASFPGDPRICPAHADQPHSATYLGDDANHEQALRHDPLIDLAALLTLSLSTLPVVVEPVAGRECIGGCAHGFGHTIDGSVLVDGDGFTVNVWRDPDWDVAADDATVGHWFLTAQRPTDTDDPNPDGICDDEPELSYIGPAHDAPVADVARWASVQIATATTLDWTGRSSYR